MVYGNLEQCWLHLLGKAWTVLMKLFSVHQWSSVCCEGHKWNSVMDVIRFETSETICWVILCLNVTKAIHIVYWLIGSVRGWLKSSASHAEPPFFRHHFLYSLYSSLHEQLEKIKSGDISVKDNGLKRNVNLRRGYRRFRWLLFSPEGRCSANDIIWKALNALNEYFGKHAHLLSFQQ